MINFQLRSRWKLITFKLPNTGVDIEAFVLFFVGGIDHPSDLLIVFEVFK